MPTAPAFRSEVLSMLQAARAEQPGSRLYLLYTPGFEDPLELAANDQRTRSRLATPHAEKSAQAMVIEFDCRKVARYLLETDPGLDDPLLEASIAFAHRYTLGQTATESAEPQGRHVAGWLVSQDEAAIIAQRLQRASAVLRTTATLPYGT